MTNSLSIQKNRTSEKIAQLYKDMVASMEHRVNKVWLQHNPSNHPVLCTTSAIADDNAAIIYH